MVNKIKIFWNDSSEELEKDVNDFIKDKIIKDIKFTSDITNESDFFNILIIYNEF